MKQQTRTLRAGCRACLIFASYWESISSIQFSSAAIDTDKMQHRCSRHLDLFIRQNRPNSARQQRPVLLDL
jgi:hypothetical protein